MNICDNRRKDDNKRKCDNIRIGNDGREGDNKRTCDNIRIGNNRMNRAIIKELQLLLTCFADLESAVDFDDLLVFVEFEFCARKIIVLFYLESKGGTRLCGIGAKKRS